MRERKGVATDFHLEIRAMSALGDGSAVGLTSNRGAEKVPDWQWKRVR